MDCWSRVDGHWLEGETEGAEVRWFNVTGDSAGELGLLADRFVLHPLSVEDCLSSAFHAPKIDEFAGHLFIVLQATATGADLPEFEELDVFIGHDFLITYQDRPLPATAAIIGAITAGQTLRPGPDGLLYEIADRAVDAMLPQVNRLADRLEKLQERAIDAAQRAYSDEVLTVRSHTGRMRRILESQLTVLQRLSRGEFGAVSEANRIYFRDVYDHLVRLDFALETLREDTEVALNTYLSVVNNRLNEVMKVLSVVSALALPAVVIAGIFGTNFDNLPGLHSNWGFAAMIGSMISIAVVMAAFFKRRRWW